MNLDLHVPRFTWPGGAAAIGPTLTTLAETAEAIGVRTLSVMDHWFQMEMMWPAEEPMLEGYTTLGFVAAKTERLRLRLLVGAAWYEREHLGLGVPFPPVAERFERLEETLQICQQMWSENNGAYDGKYYHLTETLCSPPPISRPRPRILIGGGGERKTLRLVAHYADACNLFGNATDIAHKLDVLRRHCDERGRDAAEIEVTALLNVDERMSTDDIVAVAQSLAAVGVDTIIASSSTPEPARWLEEVWGPVIPHLASIGA